MSYYLVVGPFNLLMHNEAVSLPGIFLGSGAVLTISITTFLMLVFQVSHTPACATTLIISHLYIAVPSAPDGRLVTSSFLSTGC